MTIYAPDDDKTRMFALPRYLILRGEVVLDDTELRTIPDGRTMHLTMPSDPDRVVMIQQDFDRSASIAFSHFGIDPEEIGPRVVVPCRLPSEGLA